MTAADLSLLAVFFSFRLCWELFLANARLVEDEIIYLVYISIYCLSFSNRVYY